MEPRAGVVLGDGTRCAGDLAPGVDLPCHRAARVIVWGPVTAADGSPIVGVVAACEKHARFVLRWMRRATREPDLIEAWGLEAWVEAQRLGLLDAHGFDLESAERIA